MRPPVPDKCDVCSKPLDKPMVCGRCKAFAYCAEAWPSQHKPNCSELLTDRTTPFGAERATEFEQAVRRVGRLVTDLGHVWAWAQVRGDLQDRPLPASRPTADALVRDPAFTAFYAYVFPPSLTYSSFPGEPDPNILEHRLLLVTRVFLMHDASSMTPAERASLVRFLADPAHARAAMTAAPLPLARLISWATYAKILDIQRKRHTRLHGPKLLAQPDALSAGEYRAVPSAMCAFWVVQHAEAGEAGARAREASRARAQRWEELGMVYRTAGLHGFLDAELGLA